MTTAREKVFEEASKLPEAKQETLAALVRQELAADAQWEALFNDPRSDGLLKQLADEALEEHRRGETRAMDPATM